MENMVALAFTNIHAPALKSTLRKGMNEKGMNESENPQWKEVGRILWQSSGWDLELSLPGAKVQTLVGELRSCKPGGVAKKKKRKR